MAAQDTALAKRGIPWQQCMPLPSYTLDSLKRPSMTNSRATIDATPLISDHWIMPWTSLFFDAVGVRPFFDNIWTTGTQPGNWYNLTRPNVELEAAIAVLSRGPVWLGDGPGYTNATLVNSMCRQDGLLLGPSRSMTPLDAMFADQMQQGDYGDRESFDQGRVESLGAPPGSNQLWASSSDVPVLPPCKADDPSDDACIGHRTVFGAVLGLPPAARPWNRHTAPDAPSSTLVSRPPPRHAPPAPDVLRSYTLLAVDLAGSAQVWPSDLWPPREPGQWMLAVPHGGTACGPGVAGSACGMEVVGGPDGAGFSVRTGAGNATEGVHDFAVWSVAPVLGGGWVLLGETDKVEWVSAGRFVGMGVTSGMDGVGVSVAGAVGESVRVDCVRVYGEGVHGEAGGSRDGQGDGEGPSIGAVRRVHVSVGEGGVGHGVCR